MEHVFISSATGICKLSYTYHETELGTEFAILTKVELGNHDLVEYMLSDSSDRKFYESLLESKIGLRVYQTEQDAIDDEMTWHEAYEVTA